ncbi:MAG: hypothetical protein IKE23_03895 [Exiguobacterium sp.]|nr:hypothetical protein [Exiguobacterium sp.]
MRKYAQVSPFFWIGETGRRLREYPDAQRIALYLLTCPSSEMTGVFYCPLASIANEVGIKAPSKALHSPFEGVKEGLRRLSEEGFLTYDYESEFVFVYEMARFQIAEELKPGDNRIKAVKSAIESMPCVFKEDFKRRYNVRFNLGFDVSPFEAPSKPLRSQEQEQEQDISRDSKESLVDATATTLSLSGDEKKEKVKSVLDECPYKALIDAYHEECPMMPRVLYETFMASPSRKKHMKARWLWFTKEQGCKTQEDGIREFRDYFNAAATFPFLNGQNSRGFRANLDWLMNATNMGKVIEGRYQ